MAALRSFISAKAALSLFYTCSVSNKTQKRVIIWNTKKQSGISTTAKVAAALGGTALDLGILNGLVAQRVAPAYSPALGYALLVTFTAEPSVCGYVLRKK